MANEASKKSPKVPKTAAAKGSERVIDVDAETVAVSKRWQTPQKRERVAWGRLGPTAATCSRPRTARRSTPTTSPGGTSGW
jgi:hypothetical protein